VPVCSIQTVNSATNVTASYWNFDGYNYTGGILGFGPQNTKFWQQTVGTSWSQYQLGIKLNNMTDWTPFNVQNEVFQNRSYFSIGENL